MAGASCIHIATGQTRSYFIDFKLSSMSAELVAIKKAIEFAVVLNLKKIAILSDCKSGILALKKHHSENYIIHDIIQTINDSSIEIVELHYIPEHFGIIYNDLADEAAKNAHEAGTLIDAKCRLKDAINMIDGQLERRL